LAGGCARSRDEGVLIIIGSGFLTHGLPFLRDWRPEAARPGWSREFDAWAAEALDRGALDELIDFRHGAPGMPATVSTGTGWGWPSDRYKSPDHTHTHKGSRSMSTITILGSGNMARGIGTRALAGHNRVQILDRQPDKAAALAAELGAGATSGAIGDTPTGDVVVLAVPYDAAAPLVQQYREALAGRVWSTSPTRSTSPPSSQSPRSSGAEEIAKVVPPGAKVVKAFNTTFAGTLVAGNVNQQPLDVLVAGDDDQAKAAVAGLVEAGGLRAIDTGPLTRARQLEGIGLLHIALQFSRSTQFASAVKILD